MEFGPTIPSIVWYFGGPNPLIVVCMGGCPNYDPFLGTLNIRCRIIIGIQKRDHDFDDHPYELQSKLSKGGYIGAYIGEYYRAY